MATEEGGQAREGKKLFSEWATDDTRSFCSFARNALRGPSAFVATTCHSSPAKGSSMVARESEERRLEKYVDAMKQCALRAG